MFGYVIPNQAALSPEAQERDRAAYCGLCRRIGALHGTRGRLTLSYDLTFLDLLLCSLYEGESACATGCDHCPQCRQKLRVPRGRGRIQISCPRCGTQFIKKS